MLGTVIIGSLNNFKFPLPFTLTFAWKDSEAFKDFFVKTTSKSNCPTAPLKFSGLFSLGKSLTLISFLPLVIVFWTCI